MRSPHLGLTLAAAAVLLLSLAIGAPGRDLFPPPDGPEYFDAAVNLSVRGEHAIHLAGTLQPPRYPPGFSLLMLPFLHVGSEPLQAPFLTNACAAFGVLLLLFASLWRRGLHVAAGLAPLLLVTTPAFVILARSPMAEMTSMLFVTAAVLLLAGFVRTHRLAAGAAGAGLLALAVGIRLANVMLLPAVLVAALAGRRGRRAAILGGAFAVGLLPLLLYHHAVFGSVFATGYGRWVPERAGLGAFGFEYLLPNLRCLLRELLQCEWRTTLASEYGLGSYFGPVLPVLLLLCVWLRPPRPPLRAMAIALCAQPLAMLFYFYTDARFFLQLLPIAVAFVAVRIAALLETGRWPAFAIAALLPLHLLGIPGVGAVADVPALLWRGAPPAPQHTLLQRLADEPPGLLLCTFSPPYAHAVLGDAWTVAPAEDAHEYRFNPAVFVHGAEQRRTQMLAAHRDGRPIYLVALGGLDALLQQLPGPAGEGWQVLQRQQQGGVARLRR